MSPSSRTLYVNKYITIPLTPRPFMLGILRRAVQGEYRAWARHQRKARDSTCPAFLEKMGRRVNLVVRYLIGEVSKLQSSPVSPTVLLIYA
jgi:hypothetical protein